MKKSKKFILILLSAILVLTLFLFYAVTSSAICLLWLPLASAITGKQISAEKVSISFFSSPNKVHIKNLKYSDGSEITFTASELTSSLYLYGLFSGRYKVPELALMNAELLIEKSWDPIEEVPGHIKEIDKTPSAEKKRKTQGKVFDFSTIDIGNLSVKNFTVGYEDKKNNLSGRFVVEDFTNSGFTPEKPAELQLHSFARLRGNNLEIEKLPLILTVHYTPGVRLLPRDINLNLVMDNIEGKSAGCDLKTLNIRFIVRGTWNETEHRIDFETFELSQYYENKKEMTLSVKGAFNPETLSGTMKLRAALDSARLFLTPEIRNFLPEGIVMNYDAELKADRGLLNYEGTLDLNLTRLLLQNKTFSERMKLKATHRLSANVPEKNVVLQSLRMELTDASGAKLELKSDGSLRVSNAPDEPKLSTKDATLTLTADDIRLNRFNPFIPIEFESGTLRLQAISSGDIAQEAGALKMNFEVADIAVKNLLSKNNLRGAFSLYAQNHFQNFILKDFTLKSSYAEKTFADIALNASYEKNTTTARISGKFNSDPAKFAGLLRNMEENSIFRKIKQANWKTSLDFHAGYTFSAQKGSAGATAEIASLALLDQRYSDKKAILAIDSVLNKNMITLSKLSFSAGDLVEFSAKGNYSNDSGDLDANLMLKRLKGEFVVSVLRFLELPGQDIAEAFRLNELSMEGTTYYNIKKKILNVYPLQMGLREGRNSSLLLKAETPIGLDLSNGVRFKDMTISAEAKSLNLMPVNVFFGKDPVFRFLEAETNGMLIVTAKNLWETITLNGELSGEVLCFEAVGQKYPLADYKLSASAELKNYAKQLQITRFTAISGADSGKNMELDVDGVLSFDSKNRSELTLDLKKLTGDFLEIVYPVLRENGQIKNFGMNGKADWKRNPAAETNTFQADFAIRDFESSLLKGKEEKKLSGDIHVDVMASIDGVELRDNRIRIADSQKTPLIDLTLDGGLGYGEKAQPSLVKLSSEGIDIYSIQKLFGQKQIEEPVRVVVPVEEKTKEPEPAPPPLSEQQPRQQIETEKPQELPAINLKGLEAQLILNLKNIRYTENLIATCDGTIHIIDNQLKTNEFKITINDSPLLLGGMLDFGQTDGYDYALDADLKNLALPPLIRAFHEKEIDKSMDGRINSLILHLTGKGFTRPNLEKHLAGTLALAVNDVSIPFEAKNISILTRLVFLPLELFPALIATLPENRLTTALHSLTGEVSDILTGNKNITFSQGEIDLHLQDGNFNIRKFLFHGRFIKSEILSGSFNPFNNSINLETQTDFGILKFPFAVKGKLDSPSPNYKKFLIDFMKDNALNVLSTALSVLEKGADETRKAVNDTQPETQAVGKELTPEEKLLGTGLNLLQNLLDDRKDRKK